MKKLLSLLMVLLIAILPHLPIANATIVGGAVDIDPMLEGNTAYNIFFYQGEYYAIVQDYLLKKNAESGQFEAIAKLRYMEDSTDADGKAKIPHGMPKIDGGKIYLMDDSDVYSLHIDGTEAFLESVHKVYKGSDEVFVDSHNAKIINATLYYVLNAMGESGSKLVIQKLGDSAHSTVDLDFEQYGNPIAMGAYKDSIFVTTDRKILLLENGGFKEYFSQKDMKQFMVNSMCYMPATDAFYYAENNYVYRIKDGEMTTISVLDYMTSDMFVLDDHTIAFSHPEGIATVDITTAKMPEKVLRIGGLMDQKLLTEYNKKHPEMPSINVESYMSDPQTFTVEMKGENKADVYFMDVHYYVDSLLKHEYIEPLDSNANLVATAARMYPYVQNMLKYQDKLYLMPYNIYNYGYEIQLNNLAYNIKTWEELGLTEADVPKTFEQFVKLLDKIYSEKHDVLSENQMGLISNVTAADIKLRAINLVSSNARARGEQPRFDTPEMLSLMETVAGSEFMKESSTESYLEEIPNFTSFLFLQTDDIIDIPDGYRVMPLSLTENDAPHVFATATVAFVNALSDNKPEAMAFLEHMMESLNERTQTYLFTDVNEPVKNKNLERYLEKVEKTIAKLQQDIEKDKQDGGKNVKKLQQDIEDWKEQIKTLGNRFYILTQEEIDTLNTNADNIIVIRNQIFNWQNEQMSQLMSRFYEEDIPAKEFLTELDRMVNMMSQEEEN